MPSRTPSTRAEQRQLCERMRGLGMNHREIAAEISRSYRLRPRSALRIAWGWTLDEAAARYNGHSAADPEGRASMRGTRLGEYETWPFGGRKPSFIVLGLLAEIYRVPVLDLVDIHDREKFSPRELLLLSKTTGPPRPQGAGETAIAVGGQVISPLMDRPDPRPMPPGQPSRPVLARLLLNDAVTPAPRHAMTTLTEPGNFAYGRIQGSEPELSGTAVLREVMMAAHEGSEHAERAERRDIGETTLEQIRADVIRLSHDYMAGDPWPLFQEMRQVRARIHAALDRRLWPRDETELYFLLAAVNGLMAVAANHLGHPAAAEELARNSWAYAVVIGHKPLMARVRVEMSDIAYWNRPRRSAEYAVNGLEYLSAGPNGAQLHLMHARAAARFGDASEARRAIAAASDARERRHEDDLLEIGGEFGYSHATQHYHAGSTLVEIPGAEDDALTELELATDLYAAGPEAGEDHSKHAEMIARIDLGTARLRANQLDAAVSAVGPVLALPPNKRTDPLPQRFGRVRAELADPRYHGSGQARELDERIEHFCSETILGDLRELGASVGS